MTETMLLVANELADVLEAENAALRVMDVATAVARFPRKAESARRLMLLLAEGPAPVPLACAARLRDAAWDNRVLLERAMYVQGRLIATLARAVPAPRVGYGREADARLVRPMTLYARA